MNVFLNEFGSSRSRQLAYCLVPQEAGPSPRCRTCLGLTTKLSIKMRTGMNIKMLEVCASECAHAAYSKQLVNPRRHQLLGHQGICQEFALNQPWYFKYCLYTAMEGQVFIEVSKIKIVFNKTSGVQLGESSYLRINSHFRAKEISTKMLSSSNFNHKNH